MGEILEVTTTNFVAQSLEQPRTDEPQLFDPPDFGSFVRIPLPGASLPVSTTVPDAEETDPFDSRHRDTKEVSVAPSSAFALVCFARTATLDSSRRPQALGYPDEESLRRHQPQIFELMTTEFLGLFVAFSGDDAVLRRRLPPKPPRVHAPVIACSAAETMALTSDLSFLRTVLGAPMPGGAPAEQLAGACLRQALSFRDYNDDYLVEAGKLILSLVGDDYDRLTAIMENVW